MKRSVDLTRNNMFSDQWNESRLFDPDKITKLPHKILPWEKTDEELAENKSKIDRSISHWNRWTNSFSWTQSNTINSIFEDWIEINEVHNDQELATFNASTIWTNDSSTSSTARIVSNGVTYSLNYNGGNLLYSSSSSNKTTIFYQNDKKARVCEDGDVFFLGHVKDIHIKKENMRHSKQYQRLKQKENNRKTQRSKQSSYIFYNKTYPENLSIRKLRRWKPSYHQINIVDKTKINDVLERVFNICEFDEKHGWYVTSNDIDKKAMLKFNSSRDFSILPRFTRTELDPYDPDALTKFPKRWNVINEYFNVYEEYEIKRAYVTINDKHVLLPKNVVKYKGKDFGTGHRQFPWQPKGRVSQPYDKVFEDRNEDWDIQLIPFMKELPTAL